MLKFVYGIVLRDGVVLDFTTIAAFALLQSWAANSVGRRPSYPLSPRRPSVF